jgi:hypothetical protein
VTSPAPEPQSPTISGSGDRHPSLAPISDVIKHERTDALRRDADAEAGRVRVVGYGRAVGRAGEGADNSIGKVSRGASVHVGYVR